MENEDTIGEVPPNMIRNMSASRLKTFQTCKFKYKCSYIDKIPRGETNDGARCGSVVHEMFEQMFKEKEFSSFSPFLIDACKKFEVTTKSQMARIVKNAKNLMSMGYYDDISNIVSCEDTVDEILGDGITRIYGFVDRLDIVGDTATVIDIKTQKNDFTQAELDDNLQAKIYSLATKMMYPDVENINVEFWMTASGNVQKVNCYDELEEVEEYLCEQFADIVYTTEFPPTKNKFCFWCDAYKQKLCPAHNYRTYDKAPNASDQISKKINEHSDAFGRISI